MNNRYLMAIEFEKIISNVSIPMVALYNKTRIDEETVRQKIKDGRAENDDFIVVMFKSQYDNLKDLVELNVDKDFYQDLILEQQGGLI